MLRISAGALLLLAAVGACETESSPPPAPVPALAARCTMGPAYWRDHVEAWRHLELRMGETYYSREEQVDILRAAPGDNGLVSLAQQLITSHLNLHAGAPPMGLEPTVAAADALVGALVVPPRGEGWRAPAETDAITESLRAFNMGLVGPGPCKSEPAAY
jgi:hypothetical protein